MSNSSVTRTKQAANGVARQRLTCALGLMSALLLEVAASSQTPNVVAILVSFAVQSAIVITAFVWFRRRAAKGHAAPDSLVLILAGVAALPFVVEVVAREFFSHGWTLEQTLLALLRNLVLGLCAASVWPRYQQLGAALSVLLAIFAVSFGDDRSLTVLLSLYAAMGVWWLMGSYWDGLSDHVTAEAEHSLPRRWLFVLPAGIVAVVLLLAVDRGTATTALRGFMASSGGTDWYDQFASQGVNDGEALVAAENNASSFAPVETDLFLDSEEQSLYDAINEQYSEPVKNSPSERAVALPSDLVKETEQQMAQAKKANREFSTVRQSISNCSEQEDVDTNALFFVAGRTPLHLRLEEFDLFDGQNWYPSPEPKRKRVVEIETFEDKPWVLVDVATPIHGFFDEPESHVIRTASILGNRLPLPLHTVRLHIDRVDRPDLFAWAQDSILRLQRKSVPSLMVMHTQSRAVVPESLEQLEADAFRSDTARSAVSAVPTDAGSEAIAELAAAWTEGLPRGWPQINAILDRLRTEYVHDRLHTIDAEAENPTATFLMRDRRGPDYLFASSAAVMLRSLGYPTRLVSGFYASPGRFDAKSRQTPVIKEDVHFWCEVYVGGRTWLPIEPTPGYSILAPRLSLVSRMAKAIRSAGEWCASRWIPISSTATLLALLQITGLLKGIRLGMLDAWFVMAFRLTSRTARQRAVASHRLMYRRCQSVGLKPVAGETDRSFFERVLKTSDVADELSTDLLERWLRCVEWARFAPRALPFQAADLLVGSTHDADVLGTCNSIVASLSIHQLADITRPKDRPHSAIRQTVRRWRPWQERTNSPLENATA
jgi:transglutaminase-like putative cysteine protease